MWETMTPLGDVTVSGTPAALVGKQLADDPAALPVRTMLRLATIEGARVLGLDGVIGSIEAGKHADLVVMSLDLPEANPPHDLAVNLLYSMSPRSVRDVLVDGRVLVRDGRAAELALAALVLRRDVDPAARQHHLKGGLQRPRQVAQLEPEAQIVEYALDGRRLQSDRQLQSPRQLVAAVFVEGATAALADEQHPVAEFGQTRPQIHGGRRLADAALLVRHGDDLRTLAHGWAARVSPGARAHARGGDLEIGAVFSTGPAPVVRCRQM